MIQLMPQIEAERQGVDAVQIQCISPYLNPAHVLAPPRLWLEALARGEYSWHFFRLRYKNLLRARYRAEPERFAELLRDSEGPRKLVLTCHCLTAHCHREVAKEFLERLRERSADPAAQLPPAWLRSPGKPGRLVHGPAFTRPSAALPYMARPEFAAQIMTGPELEPPAPLWRRNAEARLDRAVNG